MASGSTGGGRGLSLSTYKTATTAASLRRLKANNKAYKAARRDRF